MNCYVKRMVEALDDTDEFSDDEVLGMTGKWYNDWLTTESGKINRWTVRALNELSSAARTEVAPTDYSMEDLNWAIYVLDKVRYVQAVGLDGTKWIVFMNDQIAYNVAETLAIAHNDRNALADSGYLDYLSDLGNTHELPTGAVAAEVSEFYRVPNPIEVNAALGIDEALDDDGGSDAEADMLADTLPSRLVRITFSTIIPGEVDDEEPAEEHGWIDEEGVPMEPTEHEYEWDYARETANYLKYEGATEFSCSQFDPHGWYSDQPEGDFRTGELTTRSFHLVGYTEEELQRIYNFVTS